jgi:hypothetical protein
MNSQGKSAGRSAQEGEGDYGLCLGVESGGGVGGEVGAGLAGHFGEERGFELLGNGHGAGGDLGGRGAGEAELAVAQGVFSFGTGGADGRPEDAAGHGAPGVDVATAGEGIEGRAGSVIGEVVEAGPIEVGRAEAAGSGIAGERGAVLVEPGAGAVFKGLRGGGRGGAQGVHAGVEAGGVEGVDGEGAVTALRAAGAANQPGAGLLRCAGQSGIDDLDELGVAGGETHKGKDR